MFHAKKRGAGFLFGISKLEILHLEDDYGSCGGLAKC